MRLVSPAGADPPARAIPPQVGLPITLFAHPTYPCGPHLSFAPLSLREELAYMRIYSRDRAAGLHKQN